MKIIMIFFLERKPKTPIVKTTVLSIIYQLNGTIA
jgi:hypothetical protein